jgi:hypothetical protein
MCEMNTEMVSYLKVRIVVSLRFLLWYFSSFTSSEMWCCVPGWNCRCYEGPCTIDSSGITYVVTWGNIIQNFGLYEKLLACWKAVFDLIRIYSGVRCFVHKCTILCVTVTFIVHVRNGVQTVGFISWPLFFCDVIDVIDLNILVLDNEW